jgi:uncharacterized protein (TIGR03435 family)
MLTVAATRRGLMTIAILSLSLFARPLDSQSTTVLGLPAQVSAVPAWQTAAGGKREFDVVSIHPSKPGEFTPPNFDMTAGAKAVWWPAGGLFDADFPVYLYIAFAYKLFPTPAEAYFMLQHQPKWVSEENMEIHMRASGSPTKDQARLMMQSMLADRFKLAIHFETQTGPVLALTLIRPGKLGPKVRAHSEGPACDAPVPQRAKGSIARGPDLTPPGCGLWMSVPKPHHMMLDGARDVDMTLISAYLSTEGGVNLPIVDQTGLKGNYDFSIQWTQESDGSGAPGAGTDADAQVTTFEEALKEQLGLKLVRTTGSIVVPVIDHIERPSEN